MQKLIGPCPNQLGGGFHPHIGHHPQIQRTQIVKPLPFLQQWVIGIDQERVVKLIAQLLLERLQTGEINDKTAGVEVSRSERQ